MKKKRFGFFLFYKFHFIMPFLSEGFAQYLRNILSSLVSKVNPSPLF